MLARLFNRSAAKDKPRARTVVVTRTQSGAVVSQDSALRSDAFYAGLRFLSQTVAQPPWHAFRPSADGRSAEKLTDRRFDRVNRLLERRVNEDMGPFRFRELMVANAILYGNAIAEIERDGAGRAQAMYPIRGDRVRYKLEDGTYVFEVTNEERTPLRRFAQDEVFHIANFYGEGPVGKSIIECAAESIGWQRATELFGAAYFQNGVHPSGMITMKNALSPEAYAIFEETLKRKFSGSEGAHQPFVTDGEATYTRFAIQPDEAQFIQSLQHQIEVIARWLGVPPSKIGHLLHAGVRANVEHASIEVIQDSIMPWVLKFEQEADAKLFHPRDAFFTRMDLSALLRGDNKSRAEFYAKMLDKGVFSVNEVRRMEDMNPIGPEGDQHLVQGQYMPLDQVGREPNAEEEDDEGFDTQRIGAAGPRLLIDNRAGSAKRKADVSRRRGNADSEEPEFGVPFSDGEEWDGVRRTLNL